MTYPTVNVRVLYALGIVLIVSAMVYFFAANWGDLHRYAKVSVAVGMTMSIFATSLGLAYTRIGAWLAKPLAVAGTAAFGVTVMLLGQIYNSHADAYGLFLLWSIPALAFALLMRYWPFDIMAYVLLHLTVIFYFVQTAWFNLFKEETKAFIVTLLIAAANAIVTAVIIARRSENRVLQLISTGVTGTAIVWASNSQLFDNRAILLNVVFIAWVFWNWYYIIRLQPAHGKQELAIVAAATVGFSVSKYIELMIEFEAVQTFFFFGIIFVALLLSGTVIFVRYYRKLTKADVVTEDSLDHDDQREEQIQSPVIAAGRRLYSGLDLLMGLISLVSTFVLTASIIGFVFLVSSSSGGFISGNSQANTLAFISVLLFVVSVVTQRMKSPDVLTLTLQLTALSLGAGVVGFLDEGPAALAYGMLAFVIWTIRSGIVSNLISYAIGNIYLFLFLLQFIGNDMFDHTWYKGLALFALNVIALTLSALVKQLTFSKKATLMHHSYLTSLVIGLILVNDYPNTEWRYIIASVVFFIALLAVIYSSSTWRDRLYYRAGVAALIVFLVLKYYETVWKLLDKSFTLASVGLVLILIAYLLHRRVTIPADLPVVSAERSFVQIRRPWLIALSLFMVLSVGYIVTTNETALATGTEIKLQLRPVDPRSLIQGDYLIIDLDISHVPLSAFDKPNEVNAGDDVQVVLSNTGDNGTHVFERIYESGTKIAPGEVVVNGEVSGTNEFEMNEATIEYGIDTFFIEENTGAKRQSNAKFAKVIVPDSGNLMIVDVTAE